MADIGPTDAYPGRCTALRPHRWTGRARDVEEDDDDRGELVLTVKNARDTN